VGVRFKIEKYCNTLYPVHMNYTVDLKPRAIKDLKHLQKQDASRIADALERLQSDLTGDVKKLTNFTPEYRL